MYPLGGWGSRTDIAYRGDTVLHRIAALLLPCLVCAVLPAQEFRATISGHVYDSSGSAVPTARIQAVNVETNETTSALSDNAGSYSVPFLRPGNYNIEIREGGQTRYAERVYVVAGKTLHLRPEL